MDNGQGRGSGGRGGADLVSVASYAGMGLQFVGAILLFLYVGEWLDRRLHTNPVFVILGVFVGAGAAFYSIYRRLMAAQADEEQRKR